MWLYLNVLCCEVEKSLLRDLCNIVPTRCSPGYDSERGCMTGTRGKTCRISTTGRKILATPHLDFGSTIWPDQVKVSSHPPLHSCWTNRKCTVKPFTFPPYHVPQVQCLGASFFCKRDDPNLQDSKLVLPYIACGLVSVFAPFGRGVAAALREHYNFGTEAVWRQFNGLILKALSNKKSEDGWKPTSSCHCP